MNTVSRIEIYDNAGEKTVIQPPAGYEFTGSFTPQFTQYADALYNFETRPLELRPLPTAKEQRAEKLSKLACNSFAYTVSHFVEEVEVIFSEHPDQEAK